MSTKPGPIERAFHADLGVGAALGVDMEPHQLDMLRGEDGKLPGNVFQLARKAGPGRPPNSPNRKSAEYAKYFTHKYGDPVDYMGSTFSMPLDQAVELVLVAENYTEREERLLRLCDQAAEAMVKAVSEGWSGEKMKSVVRMVEAVERAAGSMKAKPGEIAVKVLVHQLNAAKEAAQYIRSKKPTEHVVDANLDFRAFFVGQHGTEAAPHQQALANAADAVNKGLISESDLQDLRIIDGEYTSINADDGE
ncbi:hypothetical protein [Novosphingobium sp. FKTRR1]|uniref:hypothetical protein n=1 Tax=Novosphingobium sp. FKTRR1 TaxID=2879118 RepID=UPI001CF0BDA1|nr:hypothetical protein [Novosphingobium sp. FKTRR1]